MHARLGKPPHGRVRLLRVVDDAPDDHGRGAVLEQVDPLGQGLLVSKQVVDEASVADMIPPAMLTLPSGSSDWTSGSLFQGFQPMSSTAYM